MPFEYLSPGWWRKKLNIEIGMQKDQALEIFAGWRTKQKTCRRCEGDILTIFCPVNLICKEVNNVGDAQGNGNRGRTAEIVRPEILRTRLSEARKGAPVRENVIEKEGLSRR